MKHGHRYTVDVVGGARHCSVLSTRGRWTLPSRVVVVKPLDGSLNPFARGVVEIFPGVFSKFRTRPSLGARCCPVTARSTVLVVELA